MSKKCWLGVAALFALVIGLAVGILALWPPTPGMTYANYSRIENGLSCEQVEALLGPPRLKGIGIIATSRAVPEGMWYWQDESGEIATVLFDEDGRVMLATWNGNIDDRTGLDKLRDRLPWIARNPPPLTMIVK